MRDAVSPPLATVVGDADVFRRLLASDVGADGIELPHNVAQFTIASQDDDPCIVPQWGIAERRKIAMTCPTSYGESTAQNTLPYRA